MGKTIRVLSLWQPYASAMFTYESPAATIPVKAVETRHWELKGSFPFPLAIHAAKKKYVPDYRSPFGHAVSRLKIDSTYMPYGCILGIIWATACKKVDDLVNSISDLEKLFGNYVNKDENGDFQQRYGITSDPSKIKILKTPYIMRGQQGIFSWTVPDDIEFKGQP